MNRRKAASILRELQRRQVNKPKWFNEDFEAQNDFINDPSKLKAVQCTRRAGKSFGAGLYAFKEAYENPGVSVIIIGLTRDSVKRIFMKDILHTINIKHNLGAKPNKSDLTWTLPNGSVIYLLGVDANPDDMNKLLGQKNKLVIIDESAFFRQDMSKLIYEILRPSMIDYDGTIALISTTSHLTNSLYHDITVGRKKGWSVHKWTAQDNPFIAEKWDKEIKELKASNPGIEKTPMFRRMYLNEWVIDDDALVYKHTASNEVEGMPEADYSYVLGIDLGYEDATAFVVCAYSEYDENLYVVETFKKSKMIIKDVADKIKALDNKYSFNNMVIDNASKQAVEEMRQRYTLPLIPAEKQGKRDYIELLNSDLITNKIKVLPKASGLTEEWSSLVWDERKLAQGKYVEHPACPNHLSDAFLYAWRYVYSYTAKPKVKVVAPSSEEAVDIWWEEQGEALGQDATPIWLREDNMDDSW